MPAWVYTCTHRPQVVLPVVARKKGLEGQYVQADGSPRPIPRSNVVEPVRGRTTIFAAFLTTCLRNRHLARLGTIRASTDHQETVAVLVQKSSRWTSSGSGSQRVSQRNHHESSCSRRRRHSSLRRRFHPWSPLLVGGALCVRSRPHRSRIMPTSLSLRYASLGPLRTVNEWMSLWRKILGLGVASALSCDFSSPTSIPRASSPSTLSPADCYCCARPPIQDRKSTRLNSSHSGESRMPSSA